MTKSVQTKEYAYFVEKLRKARLEAGFSQDKWQEEFDGHSPIFRTLNQAAASGRGGATAFCKALQERSDIS